MYSGYRYLTSLVLTAALAAPVAMMAAASTQDRDDKNQGQHENKRYYDKNHKDYHTWDSNEDHAYQRYQTEHHETRAFVKLNTRQKTVYWGWRHENPDQR
jgi:hypothetical protein